MQLLRLKLGALAAAGSMAAVVLAAAPALAATHPASARSTTGPEVISGAVYGRAANANAPKIPVTFRGVVDTRGLVNLGGPAGAKTHTVLSAAGKLTVRSTGRPQTSQTINRKTCYATYTEYLTYSVVGSKSTGAFAGASGPGAVQIYFAAFFPRYAAGPHKGQCNTSNSARPFNPGAVASFLASTVLTVRS